MAKMAGLRFGL